MSDFQNRYAVPFICFIVLLSIFILTHFEKYDQIPLALFAGVAAYYTHHQYMMSLDRVRLDLFEKRWAVYVAVHKFCSHVATHARINTDQDNKEDYFELMKDIYNSFRGQGLHTSKALFGKDIIDLFDRLNKSYAWLISHKTSAGYSSHKNWVNDQMDHVMFLVGLCDSLYDYFKPYIYFGNYRQLASHNCKCIACRIELK